MEYRNIGTRVACSYRYRYRYGHTRTGTGTATGSSGWHLSVLQQRASYPPRVVHSSVYSVTYMPRCPMRSRACAQCTCVLHSSACVRVHVLEYRYCIVNIEYLQYANMYMCGRVHVYYTGNSSARTSTRVLILESVLVWRLALQRAPARHPFECGRTKSRTHLSDLYKQILLE